MRLKNIGKCTIVFDGGVLEPNMVAVFDNGSEELGAALLKAYPNNLYDLDEVKKESLVTVTVAPKKKKITLKKKK